MPSFMVLRLRSPDGAPAERARNPGISAAPCLGATWLGNEVRKASFSGMGKVLRLPEKNPGLRFAPSGLRASFLLDRDALLADVDVDAGGLLALLVELIAEHHNGDDQRAEDEEQNAVPGHESFPQTAEPSA